MRKKVEYKKDYPGCRAAGFIDYLFAIGNSFTGSAIDLADLCGWLGRNLVTS